MRKADRPSRSQSPDRAAALTSPSITPREQRRKTSTTPRTRRSEHRPSAIRPPGAALPAFLAEGGEKCGVGVDNVGHVWIGNFNTRKMEEFEPTGGAPIDTVDVSGTGSPCRVRFDLSNNDMYVPQYGGQGAIRYTAASGYSAGSAQVFDTTTNATVAINATRDVVYIAGNSKVSAYDTATGSLLETFGEEGGCSIGGIAVDDATDTVFLSRGCTNRIQEWKGAVVPDAVTGDPTGNSQVSGSVALAGGGEVTNCKFEFGESTSYRAGSAVRTQQLPTPQIKRWSRPNSKTTSKGRPPITTDSSPQMRTGPPGGWTRRSPRTTSRVSPPGRLRKYPTARLGYPAPSKAMGNDTRYWFE